MSWRGTSSLSLSPWPQEYGFLVGLGTLGWVVSFCLVWLPPGLSSLKKIYKKYCRARSFSNRKNSITPHWFLCFLSLSLSLSPFQKRLPPAFCSLFWALYVRENLHSTFHLFWFRRVRVVFFKIKPPQLLCFTITVPTGPIRTYTKIGCRSSLEIWKTEALL